MITDIPAFLSGQEFVVKELGNLTLRRLYPSDFEDLMRFRSGIVTAIGDPSTARLMPDEAFFVKAALHERNSAIGLFDGARMVAFHLQFWPLTDQDLEEMHIYNYVRGRASASQIAFAAGVMVEPEFRGGIQKFLMAARFAVANHVGRNHHVSTVSFANPISWRNIMKMSGRVIAIYEFNDPRYGLTKLMFMHATPMAKRLGDDAIWLDSMDIEAQREALAKGMVGAAFRKASDGFEIAYQTEL